MRVVVRSLVLREQRRLISIVRAGWPRLRGAERLDRFGPHTAIAVPRHEHDEAVAVTHLQPPVGFDIPQRRGAHRVVAAVERQVDTVRSLAVAKAEYGAARQRAV